jgi:hypothetical protein
MRDVEAGATDPASAALDGPKTDGLAFQTPARHVNQKKGGAFLHRPFHVD